MVTTGSWLGTAPLSCVWAWILLGEFWGRLDRTLLFFFFLRATLHTLCVDTNVFASTWIPRSSVVTWPPPPALTSAQRGRSGDETNKEWTSTLSRGKDSESLSTLAAWVCAKVATTDCGRTAGPNRLKTRVWNAKQYSYKHECSLNLWRASCSDAVLVK